LDDGLLAEAVMQNSRANALVHVVRHHLLIELPKDVAASPRIGINVRRVVSDVDVANLVVALVLHGLGVRGRGEQLREMRDDTNGAEEAATLAAGHPVLGPVSLLAGRVAVVRADVAEFTGAAVSAAELRTGLLAVGTFLLARGDAAGEAEVAVGLYLGLICARGGHDCEALFMRGEVGYDERESGKGLERMLPVEKESGCVCG
jgi:hypothetical protein